MKAFKPKSKLENAPPEKSFFRQKIQFYPIISGIVEK